MLAGISVDYLVRLEQGRETNPSTSVLASLAKALRLEEPERLHLGRLGSMSTRHPGLCPTVVTGGVNETTRAVLDRMEGTPAFVLDVTAEVLAWNDAYERLMTPTGLFDLSPPNLLRFTFLSEASHTLYGDWEAIAREQVGNLRQAAAAGAEDPSIRDLVGELTMKSPDFARLWSEHDVGEKTRGTKNLVHPVVGAQNLRFEVLLILESPQRRIVVYVPDDAVTMTGLDRLFAADRAPLRLVSGNGR